MALLQRLASTGTAQVATLKFIVDDFVMTAAPPPKQSRL
jgi:hypothetical protein